VIHKSLSELAVIEEFILISNQPLYPLIHTIAATKIEPMCRQFFFEIRGTVHSNRFYLKRNSQHKTHSNGENTQSLRRKNKTSRTGERSSQSLTRKHTNTCPHTST